MNRLQRSAVHEAGHAAVAEFFDLGVSYVSMLPNTDRAGTALAHVGIVGELEGAAGATVLAAGEEAVRLAQMERFPTPPMPPAESWHRRAISVGCQCAPEGYGDDRSRMAELVDSRGETLARETARGILAESWGSVYVVADTLLREGLLLEDDLAGLLYPEDAPESRSVFYDTSAFTPGVLWSEAGLPGSFAHGAERVAVETRGHRGPPPRKGSPTFPLRSHHLRRFGEVSPPCYVGGV